MGIYAKEGELTFAWIEFTHKKLMKEIAIWCTEYAEKMSQKPKKPPNQPTNQPIPKNQPSEKPVSCCFQSLLASYMGRHPTVALGVDPAAGELYPDTLGIGVFVFYF